MASQLVEVHAWYSLCAFRGKILCGNRVVGLSDRGRSNSNTEPSGLRFSMLLAAESQAVFVWTPMSVGDMASIDWVTVESTLKAV